MKQLTAEDLVIGNKYVPHDKTPKNYGSLEYSTAWRLANEKGQGYLYYVGKDENGHLFWWVFDGDGSGDYFLPSDVTPYIEPNTEAKQYEAPATLSEVKWDGSADPSDFLPFNLEEALKSPERVVYRDGSKPLEWHYLKSSKEESRKIVSVTPRGNSRSHFIDGCWNVGRPDKYDLFLLPLPKTTYYINVLECPFSGVLGVAGPYKSGREAFKEIPLPYTCVKVVTFEI